MALQVIPVRVFFQKKGRLKYISHLDTMSLLTKALSRSNLPVWYTEGYNPHIYITLPFALSLGYEGQREVMEFKLVEEVEADVIKTRLNKLLPEELNIIDVTHPVKSSMDATWADYKMLLYYKDGADEAAEKFSEFITSPTIIVEKKSKRGMLPVDIKPAVNISEFKAVEEGLYIEGRFAAGNEYNINPRIFWESFSGFYAREPKDVRVTRVRILDSEGKDFA